MGHIICKISRIGAAISIDQPSFAVLAVILEGANVVILGDLVEVVTVALSHSVHPLSLIELFFAVVDAVAMLEVVLPGAIVVSNSIVIKINALTLHHSVADDSVVDLSIGEDVYSLSVKDITLPRPKIYISALVCINPLAFSQLAGTVDLSDVYASVGVVNFYYIGDTFESLEELRLFKVVVPDHLVFIIVLLVSKGAD